MQLGVKLVQNGVVILLGTFGVRRSSKTGFNSIPAVQCVNRYPRTKVGIAVRAGKLRRDSKEWNRLKDEKAIQTSIDYYRVRDENGRKRYLFGSQFFSRFSFIANK
jgi:hypothetical protein